ncbi:COX15/CtaA family protein [Pirellulaceae bacterium SH449]
MTPSHEVANSNNGTKQQSRKVYRWAFFVSFLTFPLIWLGGLVTTHDAGMAVPDWPGTFGYNMFLYPWTTWLFGPFDLLVEHGHRLLASLVGLIAIILCFVARKHETRRFGRIACYALLLAIISQGILGGVRVLLDARIVALIHGCCGPLVFALACGIVMINSRDWQTATRSIRSNGLRWTLRVLLVLTVVQLIMGAHLRHALPQWKPALFMSFVHTHLLMATLITGIIFSVFCLTVFGKYRGTDGLRGPATWLMGLVLIQVGLGVGTWISSYALPWQELNEFFARYTIDGRGFAETMIINGHQATGSLLIAGSLWLLCRVERRFEASAGLERMPAGLAAASS